MIRELKLYDLIGESTPEVLKLNAFFDDLFSGLSVYTQNGEPDLIFMKGDKYIMEQDLKSGFLWCRHSDFWSVLKYDFDLKTSEIQEVISYKLVNMIDEAFKMFSLTPSFRSVANPFWILAIEEAFKKGSLTPRQTLFKSFVDRGSFQELKIPKIPY